MFGLLPTFAALRGVDGEGVRGGRLGAGMKGKERE